MSDSVLIDVISTVRMLVEIALFALLGQGVLFVLAGANREHNFFYRVLRTVASPAVRFARWISPRFVVDAHVPWVAMFLLGVMWIGLAVLKIVIAAGESGG